MLGANVVTRIERKGVERPIRDMQGLSAAVLCYTNFDEVCDGNVLRTYNEHYTCELANPQDGSVVRLDGTLHDKTVIQVKARAG